ncbi:caspase family protein [Shimia sp. MMG029]|uniref:caspase family protein n=1 Tax=Shimia sp. MMG029 TaxID=3021978 RepID=UPI0022FF4087|nr:caspase family protein [Shimia sp. MMG029]MDA5556405.1 caspase family protein [Shimia sp. MMG029]
MTLILSLACVFSLPAYAEKAPVSHVALVVGSGAYAGVDALPNVLSDTQAIATRLRELGYRVVYLQNPQRQDILRALAILRLMAHDAQQVVFYLAGHGFMQDGRAYYVPVDAGGAAGQVRVGAALPVMLFARAVSERPRQKIIFFDACRSVFAAPETLEALPPLSWQAGLALAYASAPGTEAYDGRQGQSPFARAFLRHVGPQSPPLAELMRKVRLDVVQQTQGAQVPWFQSAMLIEAYLQRRPD